ncbi:zinc finger protein 438 [Pseudophryne corroboree]|uniref:zinc finger protein 438 n=1 Tax=Pseudophryne corroboree TaxID=495146 RepID=UPI003081AA66
MQQVQEICVGKTASPEETKTPLGSTGTTGRKIVSNTTHFRTIAPKVSPKIVSSCVSSSYPPSVSDIALSSPKPLIINTQNYTLMKVASHDGTFSLVALPQVSPPLGGSVLQSTGIPLHENPKLPIPRYQPAQSKKLLNKKANVLNKPKLVNTESIIAFEPKQETETTKPAPVTATEANSESSIFLGIGTEEGKVDTCALACVEKLQPVTFGTGSPIRLNVNVERIDNGTLVRCERNKVVDSTNSLAVLSPMMFGSPVHLQSIPKGKLPILPYSKITKSSISKCKDLASLVDVPLLNVGQPGVQTVTCEVQAPPPTVTVSNVSTPDSPQQSVLEHDVGNLSKQNGTIGKKKVKKRKASSETSCQPKIKLESGKLIMSKDKVRAEIVDMSDENVVSVKKYRNIMPKPIVEIHNLSSLGASTSVLQAHSAESPIRNRLLSIRPHRWRQIDQNNDSQILSSVAKVYYTCHICNRSFQFKHHLQDHLNSHTNKRPYHCRLCRKAYVHSGSLSTHMKLHHSESRLKKLMCCEFCAKVFGHIKVYFGHLKEVHRVIISTESSVKQLEKKNLTLNVKNEVNSLDRKKSGNNEDDYIPGQAEKIRLKIKCGLCHLIAPTFSDIKLHLLSVHGKEFHEILQEGVLENRQGAQEELIKQAAHYWKLLNERRNLVKCSSYDEELVASSRLKKPLCFSDAAHSDFAEDLSSPSIEEQENCQEKSLPGLCTEIQFCCGNHFNCLLCKQVFKAQNELFEHWEKQHNCENPLVLWTVFSTLLKNQKETS